MYLYELHFFMNIQYSNHDIIMLYETIRIVSLPQKVLTKIKKNHKEENVFLNLLKRHM